MELTSVVTQNLPVQAVANAVTVPAPRLRASEGASETVPRTRPAQEPSKEQVQQAAKPDLPAVNGPPSTLPRYRVHQETKQIVAQMVDEHNNVVRQIPPEELLRISARVKRLEGLFFDEKT